MAEAGGLRAAFIADLSSFSDRDAVFMDAGFGRLLDTLGERFARLTIALGSAPRRGPLHEHRLRCSPDDFIPLPWMPRMSSGFTHTLEVRRAIRRAEEGSDVSIVTLPFAAPLALLDAHAPRVYRMGSDLLHVAQVSPRFRGWRRGAAMGAALGFVSLQKLLIAGHDARVVASGERLLELFGRGRGRAVISSSIFEREIGTVIRSRPAGAPFRALFVGYLRQEKGIDLACRAFEQVRRTLPDAELHVIGTTLTERPDEVIEADLRRPFVVRHGAVSFGPALFSHFADADVFVLPSRSEGTPRVLIEARAFGCPVIGTAVGGIPTSIAHEIDGLLVPSDDVDALAAAILRVASDAELRSRLIAAGYERAREATVEAFADAIVAEAETAFASRKIGSTRRRMSM